MRNHFPLFCFVLFSFRDASTFRVFINCELCYFSRHNHQQKCLHVNEYPLMASLSSSICSNIQNANWRDGDRRRESARDYKIEFSTAKKFTNCQNTKYHSVYKYISNNTKCHLMHLQFLWYMPIQLIPLLPCLIDSIYTHLPIIIIAFQLNGMAFYLKFANFSISMAREYLCSVCVCVSVSVLNRQKYCRNETILVDIKLIARLANLVVLFLLGKEPYQKSRHSWATATAKTRGRTEQKKNTKN